MRQNFDLIKLHRDVFGLVPYIINEKGTASPASDEKPFGPLEFADRDVRSIDYSSKQIAFNKKSLYGLNIWFPIELWKSSNKAITIDACTISVALSKTIVRTPVSERKGTVKESFNVDDYKFTIRGFLIGKNQLIPEAEILTLKELHETTEPVSLHGGYPELFLDESCRVAVVSVDFPETTGKAPWIRPFTMIVESDFIDNLIL